MANADAGGAWLEEALKIFCGNNDYLVDGSGISRTFESKMEGHSTRQDEA